MECEKYEKKNDIVISSRIRLARNIKNFPFVRKLNEKSQEEIIDICKKTVLGENSPLKNNVIFLNMKDVNEVDKRNLVEKHLISTQLMDNSIKRGVLLSNDEKISIMLNEEDHIRIQSMASGFDLDLCLKNANEIDDFFEEKIEFGFDEQFGFLTCCPTNVGTGMRASVMVHLPALNLGALMDKLIASLSQLGMTIRGMYGEGSKSVGNIFQISNQITLGITENEAIEKLKQIVSEVIEQEEKVKNAYYKENKYKIEDSVMRSLGILKYCKILSNQEFMILFSNIRFGISLEIIKGLNFEDMQKLVYQVLPSSITKKYNVTNNTEVDVKRAEITNNIFLNLI
ncbi:MAG: protein arginine kinase [Clostridiales bacterium]|jgi:protein arginine kinase|nr:protein arginine kinase [Clostridiales bacterium]